MAMKIYKVIMLAWPDPRPLPFEMLEPCDGKLSCTVLRGKEADRPLTYPIQRKTHRLRVFSVPWSAEFAVDLFAQLQKIHEAMVKKHCGQRLAGHISRDATAIESREKPIKTVSS